MAQSHSKLVKLTRALTSDTVDTVLVDPTRIESIFWAEQNSINTPAALVIMRDGAKIYWMISRTEFDHFVDGFPSFFPELEPEPTLFDVGEN